MQNHLFEAALGIGKPWYVRGVAFDAARKVLTIGIDFVAGSRFAAPGVTGVHPVHDTQTKRLRHLNFFQHECNLEVRTPRVKLPSSAGIGSRVNRPANMAPTTANFLALASPPSGSRCSMFCAMRGSSARRINMSRFHTPVERQQRVGSGRSATIA